MIEIPGYTLDEELHKGTQTLIFRGIRSRDKTPVIIKTPVSSRPDLNAVARLRREYDILSSLEGPGIIKALGLEPFRKTLFLVLEDIGGRSLKQTLDGNAMGLTTFLPLARDLVKTLEHIHNNLIIHKDINPANIVFSAQ